MRRLGVDVDMGRWILFAGLYLAGGLACLIAIDATGEWSPFFGMAALAVASVVLGWFTGRSGLAGVWAWILLPLLLIPISILFGDPQPADADSPVALLAIFPAFVSMALVLVAAGARNLYDYARGRSAPTVV
jgi:hypothetical protein